MIDGSVLSNFPINLLTSNEPSVKMIMGDMVAERNKVLGLLIDETLEVKNAPPPPKDEEDDKKGIKESVKKLRVVKQRMRQLLDTMMETHDNQQIAANKDLICRLPAKTYGTMEFDMSDQRKTALVDAGALAMNECLAQRQSRLDYPTGNKK